MIRSGCFFVWLLCGLLPQSFAVANEGVVWQRVLKWASCSPIMNWPMIRCI